MQKKEPKQRSEVLGGKSSDFSSLVWTVNREVCLKGGLPAHHNLYWEMMVRTQAAETGIW